MKVTSRRTLNMWLTYGLIAGLQMVHGEWFIYFYFTQNSQNSKMISISGRSPRITSITRIINDRRKKKDE